MSSGCGDVISLEDMKTMYKHRLFEAEVITGKAGGVTGGADIDYATNQVSGQLQKTMPAVLRDVGFEPASFDFSTGGTLSVNDRNKVVYDPASLTWYSYAGTLPITVPAGFNPVGNANWKPQSDPQLRAQLASASEPGAGLVTHSNGSTVAELFDRLLGGTFDLAYRSYTVYDRLDEYISAKAFGAVGDGVADDTSAIQEAIDYCIDNMCSLYFPIGTYLITSTLIVAGSISMCGEGMAYYANSTKLKCGVADMLLIDFKGPENRIDSLSFYGYEPLDSNNGYGEVATCTGIRFLRDNGAKDIDSYIYRCAIGGFLVGVSGTGANLKISDTMFGQSRFAIDLYAAASSPDDFRGFVLDGLRFHQCGGNQKTTDAVCIRTTGIFKNSAITNNFADAGNHRFFYGSLAEGAIIDEIIIRYMDGDAITVVNTGITPSATYQTYKISNISYQTPSTVPEGMGGWCVSLTDAPGGLITDINTAFTRKGVITVTRSPEVMISDINARNINSGYATDGAIYDGVLVVDSSTNVSVANLRVRNHLSASQARSSLCVDSTSSVAARNIGGINVASVFEGGGSIRGERYNSNTSPVVTYGSAIPTSGNFSQGSIMWNTGVVAGGSPGWICITSGSPGAWRAMSNISA